MMWEAEIAIVEIGATLFGVVGAWVVGIWLSASANNMAAWICFALYVALSAALLSLVDGVIPGIAGAAFGCSSWAAFRMILNRKAACVSRPVLIKGADQ